MRFGFLNNFAAQIAAPLNDTATELELSEGAELLEAALSSADAVALTLFATDSQGNETKREVVYATAVTAGVVTVERGQEGANPQTFNPGDEVEARLTAAALNSLAADQRIGMTDLGTFYAVSNIDEHNPDPSGEGDVIALGWGAASYLWGGVAIGVAAKASYEGVAIGSNAFAGDSGDYEQDWNTAVGAYARAEGYHSSAFGSYASALGDGALAVGGYAAAPSPRSIAIGESARTGGYSSTEFDRNNAVAIGANTEVTKPEGVALGEGAKANVEGGLRLSAISYLPKAANSKLRQRHALQVVLATDNEINLRAGSSTAQLQMPPNTLFFIDAFDVVVVEASGAGGSPEIRIGPDSANPADYLAATPVTKTAVGGRETHTPLVTDGITALRVSVVTAGNGTAYQVKIIVRGYVMEV